MDDFFLRLIGTCFLWLVFMLVAIVAPIVFLVYRIFGSPTFRRRNLCRRSEAAESDDDEEGLTVTGTSTGSSSR